MNDDVKWVETMRDRGFDVIIVGGGVSPSVVVRLAEIEGMTVLGSRLEPMIRPKIAAPASGKGPRGRWGGLQ
ncbi:hypothetical protein [Pseudomonas qingdaonensis]|uniref:hypothetical protein n=1 Tax=Pseudomonas qingdaonensis TaxID=2056231 RepID=UPI0028AA5897|nr:hypothetical protein [Pseudomonas qingdaonensis]